MEIREFEESFADGAVQLILHIQNDEACIGLSLDEQPDLKDITGAYMGKGGNFWVALDQGEVVGTIAVMPIDK